MYIIETVLDRSKVEAERIANKLFKQSSIPPVFWDKIKALVKVDKFIEDGRFNSAGYAGKIQDEISYLKSKLFVRR